MLGEAAGDLIELDSLVLGGCWNLLQLHSPAAGDERVQTALISRPRICVCYMGTSPAKDYRSASFCSRSPWRTSGKVSAVGLQSAAAAACVRKNSLSWATLDQKRRRHRRRSAPLGALCGSMTTPPGKRQKQSLSKAIQSGVCCQTHTRKTGPLGLRWDFLVLRMTGYWLLMPLTFFSPLIIIVGKFSVEILTSNRVYSLSIWSKMNSLIFILKSTNTLSLVILYIILHLLFPNI